MSWCCDFFFLLCAGHVRRQTFFLASQRVEISFAPREGFLCPAKLLAPGLGARKRCAIIRRRHVSPQDANSHLPPFLSTLFSVLRVLAEPDRLGGVKQEKKIFPKSWSS
jgi:hypothetical protein